MYKFLKIFCVFALFSTLSAYRESIAETVDNSRAAELLQRADVVRSPWSDFNMIATLSYEKMQEQKKDIFRVYVKNHVNSLVCYIEPLRQRGNLLLMLDEYLWYYVNKTQRPMRITPIQKISGGASYGDISRLSWSKDYNASLAGESQITVKGNNFDTWYLKLKARSRSATYHTIDLFVEKETGYPRKAIVYLQSGKKMKTLYFTGFSSIGGKTMNTAMEFVDHLESDSKTTMTFSKVIVRKSPDRYFLKTNLSSIYLDIFN
ncbi:outer membrane lipoprotein-sorting protein [Chlorobium limicola]|uniref:Uncharacterized protein TP-0789 domain-containing protein n=1 Tax=Chlorobium limicola TaxID=1092 RepID=A0A124GAP0_CHLLI|nr:outer membrane lipoprotein-sorting protein [Chlorobium limicola]KUL32842.1 hypothetical protein ASB62_01040 [Chlorobium limicola]